MKSVHFMWQIYMNGIRMAATMERIVQEIMHRLDAIVRSECFEKSKDLEDYEKIKDDLFIRLLNVEKNRAELDDAIFRTIGDIALVLYARMGELDGCSTSVKIKQHIFEKWDKDEQMAFNECVAEYIFYFTTEDLLLGKTDLQYGL